MRRHAWVAVTVLPLLALSACGNGETDDEGNPGGTTAESGDSADPAPGSDGSEETGDGSEDAEDAEDPATGGGEAGTGTAPEPEGPQPATITIAATGDVLPHISVNESAQVYGAEQGLDYDYRPMFDDLTDLVGSADLALCHLETALSVDNTDLSVRNTLSFNTPHELAEALADTGYDGCDFASNHTMDRGVPGIEATEEVLRNHGMGYAGPTAHEDRAGRPEIYQVAAEEGTEVEVAHLAYTYTYPNSGTPTTHIPGEAPWLEESSWPVLGAEGILEQAAQAREDGADFVVLSMHWGDEYQAMPNEDQRSLATELLESGDVDLILGTHVHVIQPCEVINGRHVAYGLGNSLSNQSPLTAASLKPETQEGMVALFELTRDEEGEVTTAMSYQPTRVQINQPVVPGHLIELVTPENHPETWERTASTLDMLGGCGAEALETTP